MRHAISSLAIATTALSLSLVACGDDTSDGALATTDAGVAGADTVATNLASFDQLDFDAYTKKDWDLFRHLHCANVVVTNPDGIQTQGIDAHVAAVQALFSWAPEQAIREHPTRVGQGDWTAVVGHWTGTFSQPLMLPDGTSVPPTGKSWDIHLATFAHWQSGCIDQEQLFSDTATLQRQVGLAK